jgi:hypothetical protein
MTSAIKLREPCYVRVRRSYIIKNHGGLEFSVPGGTLHRVVAIFIHPQPHGPQLELQVGADFASRIFDCTELEPVLPHLAATICHFH